MFRIIEKVLGIGHPVETRVIRIKGMTCKGCERTIRKALLTKSGVKQVYINRQEGLAEISFDPAQTSVEALNDVILRKGYFPAGEVVAEDRN